VNRTRSRCYELLAVAAGILASCFNKEPGNPPVNPAAPAAPEWLSVVGTTINSITLRWDDRSNDELGFIIYLRQDSLWTARDTVVPNVEEHTVSPLEAGTTYHFRVTAFNEHMESAPTNEVEAQTSPLPLPNPPADVTATALAENLVHVHWTDRGTQDSFLIQRRQPTTAWIPVGSRPDNWQDFMDSTVVPVTQYYYRVGAWVPLGTVWCLDSAEVTTPEPGIPYPPDSLTVRVVVGLGVILTWVDRSSNETWFEIGRGLAGELSEVIDSVVANVTTYTDSLGDSVGYYYYLVRAVNALGHSAWSAPITADYHYCSDGIIPICLGNYWDYRDSSQTVVTMRRHLLEVAYPLGIDFYLFGETPVAGGPTDTLYYMRNFADQGAFIIGYPLFPNAQPQMLFRYPMASVGDYYYAGGDCVLVLRGRPGMSLRVGDVVYTGVLAYERFFDPGHRTIYWVRPETVGIVREDDYEGSISDPRLVHRHDLMDYYIQN
jgi:hypothetical protein